MLLGSNYVTIDYNGETIVFDNINKGLLYERAKVKYIKCCSVQEFICELARYKWNDCINVAKQIKNSNIIKTCSRDSNKQLSVAIYYRNISNGGAQRVTAQLANKWANAKNLDGTTKYRVILLTDSVNEVKQNRTLSSLAPNDMFYEALTEPSAFSEYFVEQNVIREYMPSFETTKEDKYEERYKKWQQLIDKYSIDIVVSGLWLEQTTFWDMLSIKSHATHPAFILHNHNFCCVPYLFQGDTAVRLIHMYSIADAVIVLSQMDKTFVNNFTSRVWYIPNPVEQVITTDDTPKDPNMILWVGRISDEKQPLDVIKMMGNLVIKKPNLKLYMVGEGNETLTRSIIDKVKQLGLDNNIVMTGYRDNVGDYYKKASVFVSTSLYEGFPLTTVEAASYKTPIVEYSKPWLTFAGKENGVIDVEQGDIVALADNVLTLLENDSERAILGNRAFVKYQELYKYDLEKDWDKVFTEVAFYEKPIHDMDALFMYLTEYQNKGKWAMYKRTQTTFKQLESDYNRVCTSISYRLGLFLTFPVRKAVHLIQNCVEKLSISSRGE